MNSLEKHFRALRKKGRKLFLPYLTLGDPDREQFLKIVKTLSDCGADAIEIGIPFSDPLADGPTIQRASQRALEKGFSLREGFKILKEIKKFVSIPILFMSYYNPIFALGNEKFFAQCKKSKLDGVIIPDLPFEEAKAFIEKARWVDLAVISFISPTTSLKRIEKINTISRGFIYYISLKGVTGARKSLGKGVISNIEFVKKHTTLPLCVGFGISNPGQAKQIALHADGVIIGSALVNLVEKNILNKNKMLAQIAQFVKSIRKALDETTTGA